MSATPSEALASEASPWARATNDQFVGAVREDQLQRGRLKSARQTLRQHGNMSAATVLFVLRAALDARARARGRQLMTTLGPGFTAGMLVLDAG